MIVLLILILIIGGFVVFLYLNTANGEPWIENGLIRHKIIAFFDDGTNGEISISEPVFSVSYEDKNIVSLQYILEGLVDGESIQVNVSEYSIYFQVYDNYGNFMNNLSLFCSNHIVNTVDGVFVVLMDETIDVNALVFNEFENGDYFINVIPSGSIKYLIGGQWRSSNLPSGMDFSVNLDHDPSGIPFIEIIWDTRILY